MINDIERQAIAIEFYGKVAYAKRMHYIMTGIRIDDLVVLLELLDPSGVWNPAPSCDREQGTLDLIPDAPLVRVRRPT